MFSRSKLMVKYALERNLKQQAENVGQVCKPLPDIDNLNEEASSSHVESNVSLPLREINSVNEEASSSHVESNHNKYPVASLKRRLVDYDSSSESEGHLDDSDGDSSFILSKENDISNVSDYEPLDDTDSCTGLSRWKKRNPKMWKCNMTKEKRSQCVTYKNKSKECAAKLPKNIDCSKCKFQCSNKFTEAERHEICKSYWGLSDYARQKDFIIKYVTAQPSKRCIQNKRSISKAYHLENSIGRQRVCAKFFEKTLCISNGPVNSAIMQVSSSGCFIGKDRRGHKTPGNKTSPEAFEFVIQHISSFPTMESHYVRKKSKKLYLESNLSIVKMYEMYKKECIDKKFAPVEEWTYRRIFCTKFNYSFFKPKKDLCAVCTKYEMASSQQKKDMETEYSFHIIRKNECNAEKEKDKFRAAEDSTFITANFDLQSVLNLPFSGASPFYYSRKLCVYNLTVYVGNGEDAHCYVWNELQGKRGSNEVGSILFNFLNNLSPTVREVSLFSDTCGGQNRNQQVAALLYYFVQTNTNIIKVEQKFLESGHSHMECDSMHSAIESARKNKFAFTMNDWVKIFEAARSTRNKNSKKPYITHVLKYGDFFDLQDLAGRLFKNKNKDESGNTVSWLKIKSLKFEKGFPGVIFYKYHHSDDYKSINITLGNRRSNAEYIVGLPKSLKKAYSKMLAISSKKKEDLVKLCRAGLIPEELHPWYEGLPSTSVGGVERLPEPNFDEEEDDD